MEIQRSTPAMAATLLAIVVAACSKGDANRVEASGIIETTDVVVSSHATGRILHMRVREGDRVHVGDTLYVVDDSDLRLERAQLLAGVDVARFQYDLAKNGARPEDIGQADEVVRQAKLTMDNADDDLRRYSELLKVGSISEKDYRNVVTRHDIAVRQYNAAKLGYTKLRRGSRGEDISAARARREQAAAGVAALDHKIADCVSLAPIDGVVTRRAVEEGESVAYGTGALTISKTDPVKLKIYVAENQLVRVTLGQAAELHIDTFNDKTYTGHVTYISPTAEFTPKNVQTKDDRVKLVFEVQIEVPNPRGELKSGITADALLAEHK